MHFLCAKFECLSEAAQNAETQTAICAIIGHLQDFTKALSKFHKQGIFIKHIKIRIDVGR